MASLQEEERKGGNEEASSSKAKTQHKGFGSRLMEAAENIALHFGYKKLSVISGIGVREYYKKI